MLRAAMKIVRKGPSEGLLLKEKNGVMYLEDPLLSKEDWIRHGYTTRIGGVSRGETGTMNMSFPREESRENVLENYRRIAAAIGFDWESMVLTHQTHTNTVRVVTEQDRGKGVTVPRDYCDVDGLVTNVPDLTLAVFMSDCVPVMAVDPVKRVIGAAHSGWRGTVGDIGGELIRCMQKSFGCDPKDILCAIGPSICQDCYEVSEEVIEQFRDAYEEAYWEDLFYGKENGHYQLSLWEACRRNFLRAGIAPNHISVTDLCTKCNPDLLFSHRRQGGRQGNLAGLISICLS